MNIELDIHGIKCDNSNCDYSDMSVPVSDYENWINKPCPKCGENLMTQTDFDETIKWLELAEIVNSYSEEELEAINNSMTTEDIDTALDFINENGFKFKTDSDGNQFLTK